MPTLRDQAIQTALIGDWESAIKANKELLKESPKDIDALNRLALAFSVTGKINKAKTAYQQVLKIDPLNPIAQRNLKNLKSLKQKQIPQTLQLSNNFIEESGKTKILDLLNLAPSSILQALRTGEVVSLITKRSKIFVLKGEKGEYIGVLPDDIGRRLIRFMNAGNKYEAYLKSVNLHKVTIFIKETKRVPRLRNHPTFITFSENKLMLKKAEKPNDLEEETYEEDDEGLVLETA